MQQQVRVGADRLLAERRDVAVTRLQLEAVACRAAEVGERALTRRGALGSDRTASRDGERARVEGHAAELLSVDLRPPAARRGLAGALAVGAVLRGEDRGRDADVAVEGAGVLLLDGRHVALPAEAPQDERPRAHVDDAVGPARDAVAVGVPRIGMFGDRLLGHGLQQAHAEDRGSDARSDPHDRAVTRILRGIGALNSGELAGERMAVALESQDQEDEHSCLSDNTNTPFLGGPCSERRRRDRALAGAAERDARQRLVA